MLLSSTSSPRSHQVKVEKMPDKELPKAGPESPEKVEGKAKEPGGTKNIPCRYWQNGPSADHQDDWFCMLYIY